MIDESAWNHQVSKRFSHKVGPSEMDVRVIEVSVFGGLGYLCVLAYFTKGLRQ